MPLQDSGENVGCSVKNEYRFTWMLGMSNHVTHITQGINQESSEPMVVLLIITQGITQVEREHIYIRSDPSSFA